MAAYWWEKYLGKPWVGNPSPPESFNCGELIRHVYLEELGIESLPILIDAADLRKRLKALQETMFRYDLLPLKVEQPPQEYDIIFMSKSKYKDHCGLGVETNEGVMVLHCQEGRGTVISSPFELISMGFKELLWTRYEGLNNG